jgi:hypothetical protein
MEALRQNATAMLKTRGEQGNTSQHHLSPAVD